MVENLIIQFTAAVCSSFPSFLPSLVICGIIHFTWVVLQHPWHGTAQMNTMFEENVRLSASRQCENWNSESQIIIALNYYGILYHRLLWKYDQHKNFHRKMSSELVRNIHVCCGSDIAI